MQIKLVEILQKIIYLQMLILYELQDVTALGRISCVRESDSEQVHRRISFLLEDSGWLLYSGLWSEERLLTCEVHTDPLLVQNYRALCNRTREDEQLVQRFNLNSFLSSNDSCTIMDASNKDHSALEEGKLRRKRSWIFPGTLWCGTGSNAFGFDDLGMFESADRCCREHDHCHHIIPALTVNYGVFNPNFYTVSHCDCDERFRKCLLGVNDTISSMVLYSFFKILKVPCFELKLQKRCTKLYWWGMCKVTQEAPYAIFKKPIYSNTSLTIQSEKSERSKSASIKSQLLTGILEIKPPRKETNTEEKYISEDKPRGDTFIRMKTNAYQRSNGEHFTAAPYLRTTSFSGKTKSLKSLSVHMATLNIRDQNVKVISTTPSSTPSTKRPHGHQLPKATTTRQRVTGHQLFTEKTFQSHNKKSPLTRTFPVSVPQKGIGSAQTVTISVPCCDNTTAIKPFASLKSQTQSEELDFPLQGTNNLDRGNMDSKPIELLLNNKTDRCESLKHLYECRYKIPPLKKRFGLKNLDTKPAYHCTCTRRLAREIQNLKQSSILLDLVSDHCFTLPKRKTCRHRKFCSGGFSKASDLLQALKKIEQNDIAGVQNSGKLRNGRISVQLYKRCLRLRKDAMAALT